MIAGYAVGASKAYIYLRSEYAHLMALLMNAIAQVKERGWLAPPNLRWKSGCDRPLAVMSAAKRRP